MSALHVMLEGLLAAAELAALLFISPAAGSEIGAASAVRRNSAELIANSVEVRVDGAVADVRVNQHFRNRSGARVDLAANLPEVDEYTEALKIHRSGRSVNLLQIDTGCGAEQDDEDPLSAEAGHARLQLDEIIADALQLYPGDDASIEIVARIPVQHVGKAFRFALPENADVAPQSLLIDQPDAHFLLIIPHPEERGTARLILRPFYFTADATHSATQPVAVEVVDLGELSSSPTAYVIPLVDRAQLEALAAGAIELETQTGERTVHATLTLLMRTEASPTLARTTP